MAERKTCHDHLRSIWRWVLRAIALLRLGSSIGLGAEVGRRGAVVEEAAKDRLEEGVENKLGTAALMLDQAISCGKAIVV